MHSRGLEPIQSPRNAPFIYINGNGGDQDSAVAQELQKLLENSKVLDYGTMTAPLTACLDQHEKEYAALEEKIRKTCLDAIV
jgi:hypothetical protein